MNSDNQRKKYSTWGAKASPHAWGPDGTVPNPPTDCSHSARQAHFSGRRTDITQGK